MPKADRIITEPPKAPASIDPAEIEKFARLADQWWDAAGPFAPLHAFNPVRLALIAEQAKTHFGVEDAGADPPLAGLSILDIGCGGGLVAEPMARLGGIVTAIDAEERNIKTATLHARDAGLDVTYHVGSLEGLLAQGSDGFDIVLALEIVEHVTDVAAFLKDCAYLVAPGGMLALATLNRTLKALALAIVGAEYILRWLPRGTHRFDRFVRPDEAIDALRANGLDCPDAPIGLGYDLLSGQWRRVADPSVNYMLFANSPDRRPDRPDCASNAPAREK